MARINRQKTRYQANFTLAQYGTWDRANRAARKWVRELLPTLPEPMSSKDRKTARNTSGVVGVRLANATSRKGDLVYPDWRWVAFWTDCPQSGGIGWSVKKYGEECAFVCAYLARQKESIDRDDIEKAYKKLVGTKRYASIVSLKKISPPSPKGKGRVKSAMKAAAPIVIKSVAKSATKAAATSAAKPAARKSAVKSTPKAAPKVSKKPAARQSS